MKNKTKFRLILVIGIILFIIFYFRSLSSEVGIVCDAGHAFLSPWFTIEEPVTDQKFIELLEKQVFSEAYELVECNFTISEKEDTRKLVELPRKKTEYRDIKRYVVVGKCTENKTLNYELILTKGMIYRVGWGLGPCKEPYYHIMGEPEIKKVWIELSYYHKLGEEIKVKVHNGLDVNTIYTDFWDSNWKIYQYLNKKWELVATGSQYRVPLCLCREDICSIPCPLFAPPLSRCKKLDPGDIMYWTWNQKILQRDIIKCDTIKVGCYRWVNATLGTYKVEFCYSLKKEGEIEGYCVLAGEIECVEKRFEIK